MNQRVSRQKEMKMSEGYNWRNTLKDFASISGVLAGFCVTLIGIVLGWSLGNTRLFGNITYGNISILFFGLSAVLFISASEFLLHSKKYDIFDCPEEYRKWLEKGIPEKDWEKIYIDSNKRIKILYKYGRDCYNTAISMLYLGLFFVIAPYSLFIAFLVSILGLAFQLFQVKNEVLSKLSSLTIKVTILICFLLIAFLIGCYFGHTLGRNDVVSKIKLHIDISLELSSNEVLTRLEEYFPEKLNYTQLLEWESSRLNYTEEEITRYTNPIDILNYGLGRCGEYSILYVANCLANGIPARLVIDAIVDHVWAEVNPSRDNRTWIHIEVTDSCVGIQKGKINVYDAPATINNPSYYKEKVFQLVLAFQATEEREVLIIDRTSFYSS